MSENIETKKDKPKHPVWDVYNEYRTARLNVLYYEKSYSILSRSNFWIEFFLALSVPSVASLWVWETTVGTVVWKIVLAVAALLAIIKPLVGLSDKMKENSEILYKWRSLHGEFQKLTTSISQYKRYDDKMREQFLKLLDIKTNIKEPPGATNNRLINFCKTKVNKSLPPEEFFVPEDISNDSGK